MAISNPVTCGQNTPAADGGGSSISFTTNATIPSDGKLVLVLSWVSATGVISSGSGGGLSYNIETQGANGSLHFGIVSADCPSGLASGTTVTVTFSTADCDSRYIAGMYFTGAATGASSGATGATATSATWNSGPVTVPDSGIMIGGAFIATDATSTADRGNTEVHDFQIVGDSATSSVYQIATKAIVRAKGAHGSGTTSFTAAVPAAPDTIQAGDLLLIVMESSDSTTTAGTPATPGGWTKSFEETQGGGATGVTTLTVFSLIAAGGEGNVSVTGVGDHCSGRMYVVSGHGLSSTADLVIGSGNGANTGNGTMTGITVTAGSLILMCVAITRDAANTTNFSAWANANLTAIIEEQDQTVTTGAGGGTGVASAQCAGTTTGDSTVTISTSAQWRSVHIGIKPATSGSYGIPASGLFAASAANVARAVAFAQAAGQSIDITPATETDSAQALRVLQLVAALEIDSAQALTFTKPIFVSLVQAQETDAAQGLTFTKTIFVSISPATETDAAQSLSFSQASSHTLTEANETDSAQAVTFTKTISISISPATETDAAQAFTAAHIRTITPVAETDTAQGLTEAKAVTLTTASETDSAQALTFTKTIFVSLTTATETDTAQAVSYSQAGAHSITQAAETDAAQALTFTKTIFIAITPALETDSAQVLGAGHLRAITFASETNAAQALTRAKAVTLVTAAETDEARALSITKTIFMALGLVSETDVAVALSIGVEFVMLDPIYTGRVAEALVGISDGRENGRIGDTVAGVLEEEVVE